jgi:alkaline phosphatase
VDSAASATAMTTGAKTYNYAINVNDHGKPLTTIAHELQQQGRSVGVVTSVPISHATPAAAYAHNVSRNDYQDLTRDMLGLPSISHKSEPLPGLDLLIGAGWGENKAKDAAQGSNFVPGNRYLTDDDLHQIDAAHGGQYQFVTRTPGVTGEQALQSAVNNAVSKRRKLFGYFGVPYGHLPFRTADGDFAPPAGVEPAETYTPADLSENPTLAQMTAAALSYLEHDPDGFWLMLEAGDVDWANHDNNIDNSVGAVLAGDAAYRVVTDWVEAHNAWEQTAVIVTADHGHYLVLKQPEALIPAAAK